jgi:hypothetical protein
MILQRVFGTLSALAFAASCFAGSVNVALSANGGVASQSSLWPVGGLVASNCNDGLTDGNMSLGQGCHTNFDDHAWWQVTFGADSYITSVEVFNRTDCCTDRINPFSVILYDDSSQVVWSSSGNTIGGSGVGTVSTPDVLARSLRIQLDRQDYLNLAEVEAFGDSSAPEPSALILLVLGLAGLAFLRRISHLAA